MSGLRTVPFSIFAELSCDPECRHTLLFPHGGAQACGAQAPGGLLIESFNPEPQATARPETVACGSGFNKTAGDAYEIDRGLYEDNTNNDARGSLTDTYRASGLRQDDARNAATSTLAVELPSAEWKLGRQLRCLLFRR